MPLTSFDGTTFIPSFCTLVRTLSIHFISFAMPVWPVSILIDCKEIRIDDQPISMEKEGMLEMMAVSVASKVGQVRVLDSVGSSDD